MKNRYLFIGDSYWGEQDEVPSLIVNELLLDFPALPLQFTILTSARYTPKHLFETCPREILGRQAGNIILSIGWEDLLVGMRGAELASAIMRLVNEIHKNSLARLGVVLPPALAHPLGTLRRRAAQELLDKIQETPCPERCRFLLVDTLLQAYDQAQSPRGEDCRGLLAEDGTLRPLGKSLLARFLRQELDGEPVHCWNYNQVWIPPR